MEVALKAEGSFLHRVVECKPRAGLKSRSHAPYVKIEGATFDKRPTGSDLVLMRADETRLMMNLPIAQRYRFRKSQQSRFNSSDSHELEVCLLRVQHLNMSRDCSLSFEHAPLTTRVQNHVHRKFAVK